MNTDKTQVTKDFKQKSITVSREFDAPLASVWRAYTEKELLDQWWGPAPWHAETKTMNFAPGGYWLYAMVSPENQKHWGRMNYLGIQHHQSIAIEDGFCDENGNINPAMPVSKGSIVFTPTGRGTRVEFHMTYQEESQLRQIVEMGFEQGISACFDQLDALLQRNKAN
jgi:uncharacterized protein YndB with AHSA1/START domain